MATQVEAPGSAPEAVVSAPFSLRKISLLALLALLALLVQALVLGYTYSLLIFHPGQYLVIDHYDGIKSYFSVASFLR